MLPPDILWSGNGGCGRGADRHQIHLTGSFLISKLPWATTPTWSYCRSERWGNELRGRRFAGSLLQSSIVRFSAHLK